MAGKCDGPNKNVQTGSACSKGLSSDVYLTLPHPFADRESLQTQILRKFEQEIAEVENRPQPRRVSVTGEKGNRHYGLASCICHHMSLSYFSLIALKCVLVNSQMCRITGTLSQH